jgi:hypothetical protein
MNKIKCIANFALIRIEAILICKNMNDGIIINGVIKNKESDSGIVAVSYGC